MPKKVDRKEIIKRKDYHNVFTLTIDPLDARDFDDALSVQKISDQEWEIGVHIADVAHYVSSNSHLDKEARKRGNSTYLVGEVVPMLPQSLSNGICSLVEGEDRLVKSVIFRFTNDGKLIRSKIEECIINSNKRLTYEQAILFLRGKSLDSIKQAKPPESRYSGNPGKPLSEISDDDLRKINLSVQKLWSIASKFRNARMKSGSLNLSQLKSKYWLMKKRSQKRS